MAQPPPSDEELRGVYLDWCSRQVALRFLELSGDEIWLRSHAAAPVPPPSSPASPSIVAVDRIPDYLEIVRKTALSLAQEMNLPSFAEWRENHWMEVEVSFPEVR